MIEQVLNFIHNYFISSTKRGHFEIVGGTLIIDGIKDGQYIKIEGSDLNNGIYLYPTDNLNDEEFDGTVHGLAVPPAVLKVVSDIENWMDKYGEVSNSPFQSESFGGYSYTRASGSSNSSNSSAPTWQSVFGSSLNAWRKIS